MGGTKQDDGVEEMRKAVHALDEAEDALTELYERCEKIIRDGEARAHQARQRVKALMTGGRFSGELLADAKRSLIYDRPESPPNDSATGSHRKIWQVAFALVENPVLDYQATAEKIWGPTANRSEAKNRVNAHLTQLKKLGVIKALGSNRYQVDRAKLAELSGLPLPEEAAM